MRGDRVINCRLQRPARDFTVARPLLQFAEIVPRANCVLHPVQRFRQHRLFNPGSVRLRQVAQLLARLAEIVKIRPVQGGEAPPQSP